MKDEPHPKWEQVSAALRRAGVASRPDGEDLAAPPGFATKVVSRALADRRADATGLGLWRQWSLAGAVAAVVILGGAFLVPIADDPTAPIIPVPALESELPELSAS